jgi:hypothetical protein
MRWTWCTHHRDVTAVRAVDTATHPEWHGRGIFRGLTLRLADEVRGEGVDFIFNTPTSKSRPGFIKMCWVRVGRRALWVRIMRWSRLAGALRHRSYTDPDWTADVSEAVPLVDFDDAGVEALLGTLESPRQYHTRLTSEYLVWRYRQCPAFRYFSVSSRPEEFLAVYRLRTRHGLKELTLCEIIVRPTIGAQRRAALFLRELLHRLEPDYVVASTRRPVLDSPVLVQNGFMVLPSTAPTLTVRKLALHEGMPDPSALRNWGLSIGDIELF